MPIYDFRCRDCGKVSEILVRSVHGQTIQCVECGSQNLEKLVSVSYMVKMNTPASGVTCCGSAERCEKPPCSAGNPCRRA
ncbi:MAG: zinc ribbon domain-containing protein [Chloroflexota bacterium]|nr:zinc ribbon domain-containing protein [Chloroflexota bacterium]